MLQAKQRVDDDSAEARKRGESVGTAPSANKVATASAGGESQAFCMRHCVAWAVPQVEMSCSYRRFLHTSATRQSIAETCVLPCVVTTPATVKRTLATPRRQRADGARPAPARCESKSGPGRPRTPGVPRARPRGGRAAAGREPRIAQVRPRRARPGRRAWRQVIGDRAPCLSLGRGPGLAALPAAPLLARQPAARPSRPERGPRDAAPLSPP